MGIIATARSVPIADNEHSNTKNKLQVMGEGEADIKLGIWCNTQRKSRNNKNLSQERIKKLNDVQFVWDPLDESWEMHRGVHLPMVMLHRERSAAHSSVLVNAV